MKLSSFNITVRHKDEVSVTEISSEIQGYIAEIFSLDPLVTITKFKPNGKNIFIELGERKEPF
ncbi:hypothetical protein KAU11_08680 [Candidatus Babeliales bacterium]|nr:hypothetical protein [Candidatus Babeliales bacterium]